MPSLKCIRAADAWPQVNKLDWAVWNVVFLFVLFLVGALCCTLLLLPCSLRSFASFLFAFKSPDWRLLISC
jgi:hypothetical protein